MIFGLFFQCAFQLLIYKSVYEFEPQIVIVLGRRISFSAIFYAENILFLLL